MSDLELILTLGKRVDALEAELAQLKAKTDLGGVRISGLTLEQITAAWGAMLAAVREESESTL